MEIEIILPEGVKAEKRGGELVFTKNGKENSKELSNPSIAIDIKKGKLVLKTVRDNRNLKTLINTFASHIENLIKGLSEPFVYKLKICGSHFPITVKVEGKNIIISNYLGEKVPRKCRIVGDAEVKVDGNIITVTSNNKEYAGMTAGIIEKTVQIKLHDRRIFQDGIYITEKAGNKV
ncbi:50S ribosomal protein L6 [archaeon CG07_land_8_20_14_0_80_38_8]|nr:MAG: 50S ribosomal protein L6 [archaeon CG07_land_8_20_14_0_80_38_8]PIU88970.1 MAG: 50S ribosomal protein L6 [archaeon CG06_land_8_20_14_3_00_37_11]